MATNIELDRRITDLQQVVNKHLVDCADGNARIANALGLNEGQQPINKRLDNLEKTPQRAIVWIGGIVFASWLTVVIQNYLQHDQTQSAVAVAAQSSQAAAQQSAQAVRTLKTLVPQ